MPEANTSTQGIIETATVAEAGDATIDDKAVTPAGLQSELTAAVGNIEATPSGVFNWFTGTTAPTGWLVCNGDTVPNGFGTVQTVEADYSALHAVVGTTYGTAGTLPNMQGTFVRGWTSSDSGAYDATTNPDPSRTFGNRQADAALDHAHDYTDPQHKHSNGNVGGNCAPGGVSQSAVNDTGLADTEIVINGITRTTSSETYKGSIATDKVDSNETRPVNIALLPIIKI